MELGTSFANSLTVNSDQRMNKLTSDAYEFEVFNDNIVRIVLTHVETQKTITFNKTGGHSAALFNHMMSLTDELCDQWMFPKKQGKKKKN